NCDAFIVFRSFPSQENAPENSNQKRSSLKGSDQPDPGSSAIKSLIAKDSFHGADARWLDSGSRPE
ncbi:hypothetical protein, partial [Agrobacterium tumefaciens]|uniref:hypothetical protein n=1 Tax=Agrobacterium tumefaciens TaxID=358 RepID=UPI001BAA00FA